jgi:hypothetical protein
LRLLSLHTTQVHNNFPLIQQTALGDRLAHTQVIEGLGAKDLATSFQEWWMKVFGELERDSRRRRRQPAER